MKTNMEELDDMMKAEAKKHGDITLRIFVSSPNASAEEIAKESVAMHKDYLEGRFTDMTGKEFY